MAKTPDTTDAPKKKSGAEKHMAVWLLMAMIVTGLGGWGVTNFGRNVAAIGKVGDREISANDYARALKSSLTSMSRQFGVDITLEQAQAMGVDRQVLQGIVTRTAMDAENDRLGLSVGDVVVAEQVKTNKAFQGVTGTFDRDAYRQTLQQNGLTEKDYEAGIRGDVSRQILRGAISGGLQAPASLVQAIYAYQQEKRGFTVLQLTEASLPAPLPAPTDADLKAYYDAHIDTFTRPAGKKITYAALLPETLAPSMTVDDKAVEDAYNAKLDQYQIPEKRLVERLVYPSDAEASAAKAKLDAGTATFEDLVKERGLALEDIDMGDMDKASLGAAGDAIFGLTANGVVGPLPSDLGPALYRMNGILAAQNTSLADAKPELLKDLQIEAAKKAIADKVEAIDDALAGGATLEDLAKEQGMTLVTTDYAPGADDNDPLAADKAWAAEAAKIAVGDYAEATALDNGGIAALRMEADVPAAPVPMDKIKDKVTAAWHADALHKALTALAAEDKAKLDGGATLASLGTPVVNEPVTRDHQVDGAPADLMTSVFTLAANAATVIDTADYVALVHLDQIVAAPADGADAKTARDTIAADIKQGLGNDISDLYGRALIGEQKVTLDQAAINAVYASFR